MLLIYILSTFSMVWCLYKICMLTPDETEGKQASEFIVYLHTGARVSSYWCQSIFILLPEYLHSGAGVSSYCCQSIFILLPEYLHTGARVSSYCCQSIFILVPEYLHTGSRVSSYCCQSIFILVPEYPEKTVSSNYLKVC